MKYSAKNQASAAADKAIFVEQHCCGHILSARAYFAGEDLCVLLTGGDSPHVGSASLGIARKSLKNDGSDSATVSTLNVTGHKDDVLGDMFAGRLAAILGKTVCVVCGVHFDNATPEELEQILRDARVLLEKLEAEIQ